MPKREKKQSKKPRKVKNIIQQVIVNVSGKSTRKRQARKRAPKEEVDVMARVAPSIVYFPAPSVNLPAPFSSQVPRTLSESVAKEAYVKASEPIKISQTNNSLDKIGDNISQKEFGPTANFISENDKIKTQSSIINPITIEKAFEEPTVFGSSRFGEEEEEEYILPPRPKIQKPRTKSFKNMKKIELQELYRSKMGSEPNNLTRFELIRSLEKAYNL